MKARHTVLGYGTKVWFQIPVAAATCQAPKNDRTDSAGSAARVSRPAVPGPRAAGRFSSGTTSTNTDTQLMSAGRGRS